MTQVSRYALIALMPLFLSGCSTVRPKYLAESEVVKTEGSYTHLASGMTFPQAVGEFRRGSVLRFDAQGLDIVVDYELFVHPGGFVAGVYVYPAPSLIPIGSPSAQARLSRAEFEARKREIVHSHPDARLIKEEDVSLRQAGKTYSGKMVTLEYEQVFSDRREIERSSLYLFCYVGRKWAIRYLFMYSKDTDATKEIEDFMRSFQWTLTSS